MPCLAHFRSSSRKARSESFGLRCLRGCGRMSRRSFCSTGNWGDSAICGSSGDNSCWGWGWEARVWVGREWVGKVWVGMEWVGREWVLGDKVWEAAELVAAELVAVELVAAELVAQVWVAQV